MNVAHNGSQFRMWNVAVEPIASETPTETQVDANMRCFADSMYYS